ncbi:MAG: TetR/AcrR family transcriptional regulator [Puniceicoccales bacterium]
MDATATRERILEAAERHYAERGFDGMSMRALTTEAGVNLAAVNYHFGSKRELIYAIFKERIIPINAERMELLKKAHEELGEGALPLETTMDAFLLPVMNRAFEAGKANIHFLRMVGRFLSEDADFWQRISMDDFYQTSKAFKAEIKQALPELSDEEIAVRFHFTVGAMLGALVKQQQFMKEMEGCRCCEDISIMFERLRNFLCAGIRAQQTVTV